jgi:vacuolar protein sorting-associated protein VTA1
MSSSPLGLPLVPPELKAILPYLQRADELKKQDSIISYWCKIIRLNYPAVTKASRPGTYYAAQLGIGLKARDNLSRDLLFALLGVLEKMKADIGPNDAVDIESVSSAYVEQFALRVFENADNEDRNGRATRYDGLTFELNGSSS